MTPPLSLAALTVLEVSPLAMVGIAAQAGFSHVGLRPVPATAHEPHWPILDDAALARELRRALADAGIGVLDVEIVRLVPEIDWNRMARVIAFAQAFGAERMLVADNDPDPARARDSLARLAELARPAGVIPALEFMPWTCAPNLAAARARIAGIEGAALLVDAFHLARSGGQVRDLGQRDPAVSYLQLADIAGPIPDMAVILAEARSERLPPGDGEIDLVGLLRRLPGLPISVEVPMDARRDGGMDALARATLVAKRARAVMAAAQAPALS